MMQVPPPQPGPTKEEPWGSEDPLIWCARKVRRLTLISSATIAFLILLFGAGMYSLFTAVIYDSDADLEGQGGLILLLITPLVLAIAGGILTAILAKNVGRLAKQPGAPSGASMAKLVLWISAALWFFLFIVFFISILTITEGGEEGSDGDFPVGILTILPVYMGLCLAVFTSGAAMAATSEENRIEGLLVLGLGWAAFIVFLILPALLSSWDIGSGKEIDWDSATYWLRFGNLFPAVLPWLIVLALNWIHVKSIDILESSGTAPTVAAYGAISNGSKGNGCNQCGGALSVHPKTQEVFCTACGAGLASEVVVVDAATSDNLFVEQQKPPQPVLEPAPMHTAAPPAAESVHVDPNECTICWGKLATLTMSQQLYCTACGSGLPEGQATQPVDQKQQVPPTQPVQQAPPAQPVQQAPLAQPVHQVPPNAQIQQGPPSQPVQQAPPPPQTQPPPQAQTGPPPVPVHPPAPPQVAPRASGKCSNCGGAMTVHPRTNEMFCPACGAGLSQEPHVPWPPP